MRVLLALAFLFAGPVHAQQQVGPSKEFITSVTYGVLAGTLVGVASLAFTTNPGENLNKIARGASLGLYLGIGLGLYVAYGVSDGNENQDVVGIFPVIGNHGVEGASGFYTLSF
ncbi:MAG: hypothetical protein A4S09_04225 [Proteobacteria bacterium SG_bin7]|nr:MAG: hypothetical protein A4S09_04225 [Proteobacteria bacterium SG_bin7]